MKSTPIISKKMFAHLYYFGVQISYYLTFVRICVNVFLKYFRHFTISYKTIDRIFTKGPKGTRGEQGPPSLIDPSCVCDTNDPPPCEVLEQTNYKVQFTLDGVNSNDFEIKARKGVYYLCLKDVTSIDYSNKVFALQWNLSFTVFIYQTNLPVIGTCRCSSLAIKNIAKISNLSINNAIINIVPK
jgi:hypothetical protein